MVAQSQSSRYSVSVHWVHCHSPTTPIISPPLEWPPFSLPCLVELNSMNPLQDFFMVLLQLEEGATSGVAMFKTSLRVEEES